MSTLIKTTCTHARRGEGGGPPGRTPTAKWRREEGARRSHSQARVTTSRCQPGTRGSGEDWDTAVSMCPHGLSISHKDLLLSPHSGGALPETSEPNRSESAGTSQVPPDQTCDPSASSSVVPAPNAHTDSNPEAT